MGIKYNKNKIKTALNTLTGNINNADNSTTYNVKQMVQVEKIENAAALIHNDSLSIEETLLLGNYRALTKAQKIKIHNEIKQMLVDNTDVMWDLSNSGGNASKTSGTK